MRSIFVFVGQIQDGFFQLHAGIDPVFKTENQGGKQEQVGRHTRKQGQAGQPTQCLGSLEIGEGEDHEARTNRHHAVYHAHPYLRNGMIERIPQATVVLNQLAPESGHEVNGRIDGDTEGDGEDQNGTGLQGHIEIAHGSGRNQQRHQIRNDGNHHHANAGEQQAHGQRDDEQ